MMMKLYEISGAIAILQDLEGVDPEVIKDSLDAYEGELSDKVENIVKTMKNLEAEEEAFKLEAKRLAERAKSAANKKEWLKAYLDENLQLIGVKNVKAGIFEVKYKKNPPSVEVLDEAAIPENWFKFEPKLDKAGMKDALKAGEEIPGVTLVQKESLQIK
jgi:hypothetical protein